MTGDTGAFGAVAVTPGMYGVLFTGGFGARSFLMKSNIVVDIYL